MFDIRFQSFSLFVLIRSALPDKTQAFSKSARFNIFKYFQAAPLHCQIGIDPQDPGESHGLKEGLVSARPPVQVHAYPLRLAELHLRVEHHVDGEVLAGLLHRAPAMPSHQRLPRINSQIHGRGKKSCFHE